jgi:hypothetical protein
MSTPKPNKLNQFLQNHPMGSVVTSRFLAENHISNDLARIYVASNWLTRIGRGAYIRTGDTVDWQGALYAMQTQLGLSVHAGGLTALQMKGLGHYLPMTEGTVHLFSDGSERLPDWFKRYDWGTTIEHHSGALFNLPAGVSLSKVPHKGFEIQISTPERAAFEMLSLVKTNDDFDYTSTVFEGLATLRPKEVQRLLVACRSVKVKRMFLWMAKDLDHPWVKHLDLDAVDLGKGKRVIYANGRFDKEFQITVPRENLDGC